MHQCQHINFVLLDVIKNSPGIKADFTQTVVIEFGDFFANLRMLKGVLGFVDQGLSNCFCIERRILGDVFVNGF